MRKSEVTRRKILEGAAKVFAQKSFHEATIQNIADMAGTGKGTIYYYIRRKEDLLISLLTVSWENLFQEISERFKRSRNASEKLVGIIEAHMAALAKRRYLLPLIIEGIVVRDKRLKKLLTSFRRKYLRLIEKVLAAGIECGEFRKVDTHQVAQILFGLTVSYFLQIDFFNEPMDIKLAGQTIADFILSGVKCH
jgi:TetR/AcrR family fatty acid metabolism transcriptional regulator